MKKSTLHASALARATPQSFFDGESVERVDIPATSGDMGILANHVPTIQQMKPGVVEVTLEGGKSKKVFGRKSRGPVGAFVSWKALVFNMPCLL